MKNECNIIRDILPLYAENMASDDTKEFVDEHLAGCPACSNTLEEMKEPVSMQPGAGITPLKKLKNQLFKKRVQAVICTVAMVAAILLSAFAYLTAPNYLPYSEDLLTLTEQDDGSILISFDKAVTGYNLDVSIGDSEEPIRTYRVSAFSTTLDKYILKRSAQNLILNPNDIFVVTLNENDEAEQDADIELALNPNENYSLTISENGEAEAGDDVTLKPIVNDPCLIYYSMNNGSEDVLIYGDAPNSGTTALPRLVLGYYLILAAAALVVLALALLLFRKKEALKTWIVRLLPLPACYMLGHLCVKGFTTMTYSSSRDVALITLVALLLYLACLSGMRLYRARKESKPVR